MDAADFAVSNYDWLLAADNAAQDSPERYAAYQETVANWHRVKTGTYRPFLRRESVVFTLYRRP
jgi:hypothetical protein